MVSHFSNRDPTVSAPFLSRHYQVYHATKLKPHLRSMFRRSLMRLQCCRSSIDSPLDYIRFWCAEIKIYNLDGTLYSLAPTLPSGVIFKPQTYNVKQLQQPIAFCSWTLDMLLAFAGRAASAFCHKLWRMFLGKDIDSRTAS